MGNFSLWVFHQCVVLNNRIVAIKGEDGKNESWENTVTKEKFHLNKEEDNEDS